MSCYYMSFLIFFKLCISALFVANEQYFKAITSAFLQHHHFTKATGIFKDVTVTFFYYRVSPSLSEQQSRPHSLGERSLVFIYPQNLPHIIHLQTLEIRRSRWSFLAADGGESLCVLFPKQKCPSRGTFVPALPQPLER